MVNKYGVDTLRLWMYSVNQLGEPKNFDEKTVNELNNKIFNLLYNVLAFYEIYRDETREVVEMPEDTDNVLDLWIYEKMKSLANSVTEGLENYQLLDPVRKIRDFIDDLSTWYLRRSRDRIKEGDVKAKQTMFFILNRLCVLMAPFAPFASEDIWQKLKKDKSDEDYKESVHLVSWLEKFEVNLDIINNMQKAREIVTLGLQARQKAGIPVRQPLGELLITNYQLPLEYMEIVKEELNVKNIRFEEGAELKVSLDLNITEDLKQEGNYRELVRAIQDIRKKNGLNPNDIVNLEVFSVGEGQELVEKFKELLKKSVSAKEIIFKENEGSPVKVDNIEFIINVVN
jgi:isoleucyl-tRNA synthetase